MPESGKIPESISKQWWVPADNNAAEQAIRGFCIGKRNWHMIDTIHGAQASAIKHMDETDLDFLEKLLP